MTGSEPPVGGMQAGEAMAVPPSPLARLREGLADPRDPVALDFSASGELLVARVRILLLAILFLIQLVPGGEIENRLVSLPLNIAALVVAALFYLLAAHQPRPWLGFVSSAVDVTLVSCGLAAFFLLGRPHTAVNSRALFEVYFLAIGGTSLRYNWRVCALTGALAIVQYAAIVAYGTARWNLNDPRFAPFRYGVLDWNIQGARIILLAAAAVLSAVIVLRAQRLRQLSDTDRLTGAANRSAFDERLAEEANRARRYSRPLALAIIDVDHVKGINDTHGRAAGDEVLRAVGRILRRSLRRGDLVARFGGEEFALILPETTAEMVIPKLERLRHEVAGARVPIGRRKAQAASVTLSIGVANWPDDGVEIADVLACADARLYEAKRLGRDRTVGPGPDQPRATEPPGLAPRV